MWPWAHLAVGYLVYAGYVRSRTGRRPADVPALAAALGTQVPDLVDKPLGWYLGVLPGGRSLAHSLLVAGIVLGVGTAAFRQHRQFAAWLAFAIGYASHVATDAIDPILSGRHADLAFLVWPVVPLPEYGGPESALALLTGIEPTPYFVVQLALTAVGVAVWIRQGRPGLGPVRGWLRRRGIAA